MYDYGRGGFLRSLPPVTLNLLIINVALWVVCSFMPDFGDTVYRHLGLHYWIAKDFNPIQPVTYMFLQAPLGSGAGLGHIFFNMFALYTFGRVLERTWGSRRFLMFYFVTGIGAALVQELTWMVEIGREYESTVASLINIGLDQARELI